MVSAEPQTKAAISRNAAATSSRSARWIASASRRAASRASHAIAQYSRTERICRPILHFGCSRRFNGSLDLDQVPVPGRASAIGPHGAQFDPLFLVRARLPALCRSGTTRSVPAVVRKLQGVDNISPEREPGDPGNCAGFDDLIAQEQAPSGLWSEGRCETGGTSLL